jgi:hypothetical protein
MNDRQTEQLIATPAVFGHFELEKELGRGGMGGVYLARDRMLDRRVGIKVMLKSLGDDPAFVERFQREAQAAARLNHPNIAQIYSFGTEQGMPYIAMELVSGGSLDKEMEANPGTLDPVRVMKIGLQMAEALATAADQGLVHGDVKPENVLFDADGNAKLVDFGLAAMQGDSDEIWGTPYYISPEKVRRQKIDFRADIYSLGGTLYHALTGVAPFEGEDATAVVRARFDGPPAPPSEMRPDLPKDLDAIVMRMLELEPSMRYPTYQSLIGDIKRFLAKTTPLKTSRLASGRLKIKGVRPMIKPAARGETGAEESSSGAAVRPLVESVPERRANVGRMVALAALGVVLAVVGTVGGLVWYVKASKESKQRAELAQAVAKALEAREAIAKTVKNTDEYAASFHDLAVRGERLMTDATRKITADLPAEMRAVAEPLLAFALDNDKLIAEAVAYTNKLLSAEQKPAEERKPEAKAGEKPEAKAGEKASAEKKAVKRELTGEEAEEAAAARALAEQEARVNGKPLPKEVQDGVKKAVQDGVKVEVKTVKLEGGKAAEAAALMSAAASAMTSKVTLPPAVVKFAELWGDVALCRAADIHVQGHAKLVRRLAARADGVKGETWADAQTLAQISQEVLEAHDKMRSLKCVAQAQRRAGVIRSSSQTLVKNAVIQIANARAKAEKEARDAAEKKEREEKAKAEKEERERLKAEEPKAAEAKFEELSGTLLKSLEWDRALRQLRPMAETCKTPEGREAVRSQVHKVECMQGMHEHFIKFAKGFKFKDGSVVQAVDGKQLTIQKLKSVRGRMEPDKVVKIEWTRFYGKTEYVRYMNDFINALVIKGRETTKIGPLPWSRHMLGAALTLKHLYTEVAGAEKMAPVLVKTAVKEFNESARWAAKWFPDVELEVNEQ